MRWIVLCVLAIVLTGCASRDPHLRRISGPSITMEDKLVFSAIAGNSSSIRYYHALRPGTYKAVMEDLDGIYYQGTDALLILGGQINNSDGTTEEPLAIGGFWLAKRNDASPSMRLFYLPKFRDEGTMINGVIVRTIATQGTNLSLGQAGVTGALGGAIAGAIIDSGVVGYGPKNGEPLFVPRKMLEKEDQLFAEALKRAELTGSKSVR